MTGQLRLLTGSRSCLPRYLTTMKSAWIAAGSAGYLAVNILMYSRLRTGEERLSSGVTGVPFIPFWLSGAWDIWNIKEEGMIFLPATAYLFRPELGNTIFREDMRYFCPNCESMFGIAG